MQRLRKYVLDATGISIISIVVVALSFVVAYQFVGPAPPKHIVLVTGEAAGAYHLFGEKLAAHLAQEGIRVELRTTAGAVENLTLLDSADGVDLGFVQGGLADFVATENVMAVGSFYLEPAWLFSRTDVDIAGLGDLLGKRTSVGAEGSGTRVVALHLLDAHGLNSENSELLSLSSDQLADAFRNNDIDAALVIGAPESEHIANLVSLQGIKIHDVARADALVRRFPYLLKVSLPQGVLNLQANLPETDINTVAVTAMLAANRDLHPALIDLLLVAAADIHGGHSLLSDAGQFPTPRYADLPLSEEAERHFKYGPPLLLRYLPFWAATLVDRLWIMLLPLIGLAIPLVKLVPPAYHWHIRRRLLRLYAELDLIDPHGNAIEDEADVAARLQKLEQIDNASVLESVPKSYKENVYKLRRDIDLVRRRIVAKSVPSASRVVGAERLHQ